MILVSRNLLNIFLKSYEKLARLSLNGKFQNEGFKNINLCFDQNPKRFFFKPENKTGFVKNFHCFKIT